MIRVASDVIQSKHLVMTDYTKDLWVLQKIYEFYKKNFAWLNHIKKKLSFIKFLKTVMIKHRILTVIKITSRF